MTMPGAPPLLSLHDAGVRFGSTPALHGVSLALHRGERLALVGANGAGKTTLLRLLHGLLAPSSGERRALTHGHGGPNAAMVFQRPFLLHLPVAWNVHVALWLRGVPAAQRRQRTAEALRRVGLWQLAARPALALSAGQQQRLALARAWALRPELLFLDEPTANLDPSAKREVEALMAAFADDGMTLVFSTHNLGQAKRLATRVLYLEDGRLLADQPTDRFFSTPGDLPEPARRFLQGELPWPT